MADGRRFQTVGRARTARTVGEESAREVEADGEWLWFGRLGELDDGALHLTFADAEHSHPVHRRNDVVIVAAADRKTNDKRAILLTCTPDLVTFARTRRPVMVCSYDNSIVARNGQQ